MESKVRQHLYSAWVLINLIWCMYWDFIKHPNHKGTKFNWIVPAKIAYQQWKIY
jgi:hypothetical protein